MKKNKTVYESMRENRIVEILDCAQKLFLQNGIGKTSMKEIAAELSITRATLYKYFSNIEEIAYEIEYKAISNFSNYLDKKRTKEGTAIAKITRMLSIFERFADEYPEDIMFTAMFDTYFGNAVPDEKTQSKLNEVIHHFIVFHDLIDEGKIDGTIKIDIDADVMNLVISNLLVALMQRMTLRGEVIKKEQHIEDSKQIFETINNMIISFIKK